MFIVKEIFQHEAERKHKNNNTFKVNGKMIEYLSRRRSHKKKSIHDDGVGVSPGGQ